MFKDALDWLYAAGCMLDNRDVDTPFAVKQTPQYFTHFKQLFVSEEEVVVSISQDGFYNPYHPRILFEDPRADKADWSYSQIATFLRGDKNDEALRAQTLLDLLRTGVFSSAITWEPAHKTIYAALLTTMFLVEANKDNLCYLTAPMVLEGVAQQYYTFDHIFVECDPTNERGLCGRLGAFPLASTDHWTFNGRREILSLQPGFLGIIPFTSVMQKVRNSEWLTKDYETTKKDMLVLVQWCKQQIPKHEAIDKATLRQMILEKFFITMNYYYNVPL